MDEYVVITKAAHSQVIKSIEGEWGDGYPGSFPRGTDPLLPVANMIAVDRARFERIQFLGYAAQRYIENKSDFKRLQDFGLALSEIQAGDLDKIAE